MTYLERMKVRGQLLRAVRSFFEERDFVEVDTPIAIRAPAPELHIEAPAVSLRGDARYLQTSPELGMKRLLARGFERIFQLAPTFRQDDYSRLHRPEFRMLEWYRRDAPWNILLADCEGILAACAHAVGTEHPTLKVSPPFPRITVEQAFMEHAGFSILSCLERERLCRQVEALGLRPSANDSWSDLFHRVFLDRVEPELTKSRTPFFLVDYPAPLASLARHSPHDSRVAERFELYCDGLELANGFGELVDSAEQRERFAAERKARVGAGFADYPVDERFLDDLDSLPESAGIAMGFDRLVLCFIEGDDLDSTAFLPWDET